MHIRLVVPLVLALGACASAPDISYHTLDMGPSGRVETDRNLRVERFVTSQALGRNEIFIQESATRVEFYATARWTAGVGELVRDKLAAEFGPPDAGRRSLRVGGRVVAFGQVDADAGPVGRVVLEVSIRDADAQGSGTPLMEKTYEASRRADRESVDAVVVALSRAMEDVAVAIAADAAGLRAGDGADHEEADGETPTAG